MKPIRKTWFNRVKKIIRLFVKPTRFVTLGEEIEDGSIIVCNHSGAGAPLAWELYSDHQFRFWGTYEMNSGLRSVYRYLVHTYYVQKKKWNILAARLFSLIAAPFATMFYAGMNLISTYRDTRFRKSLAESFVTLERKESLVIFPEDSSDGYYDVLKSYHAGVVLLASLCLKRGMDLKLYVAYYQRKTKTCVVSKPVRLSSLFRDGATRDEIARRLCEECNALGLYDVATAPDLSAAS
ncbi:MAG: hypothetical protein IJW46_04550 [Clostridia bacterium]|nr:hypothetical protein [Clostridia bacterium]